MINGPSGLCYIGTINRILYLVIVKNYLKIFYVIGPIMEIKMLIYIASRQVNDMDICFYKTINLIFLYRIAEH